MDTQTTINHLEALWVELFYDADYRIIPDDLDRSCAMLEAIRLLERKLKYESRQNG